MYDILKHREEIRNRILKSFETDDFEKAAAAIGEIRTWGGVEYKKVDVGRWVKVTNGKEKQVAGSGVKKQIRARQEDIKNSWENVQREFEKSLDNKFPKGTVQYNVFFQRAWLGETERNEFLKRLREEQRDLEDEIKEIDAAAKEDSRQKRESKTGKKEYDVEHVQKSFEEARRMFNEVRKRIPRTGTAKEIMPEVTVDDYFLETETTFKGIMKREDGYREVSERWKKMKADKRYDFHESPKSSSQYLVDRTTGDVYRYSDHWGKVASCDWDLESKNEEKWDIGVSNLKDFQRKDSGTWFNPVFREKMVEAADVVLPRVAFLMKDNEKFYLTPKAKKEAQALSQEILKDLQWSAALSVEEVDKIRKKYELI